MRKWGASPLVVMAFAVSLAFASQAFAAVTVIENPDAAYVAETTLIDFSALPDMAEVTSVGNGELTVTFDGVVRATPDLVGGAGVELWGNPGEVEDPYPRILQTYAGVMSRTLLLDRPVHEFGFEAAGWDFGSTTLVVTFKVSSDGETLETITRTISSPYGNFNARLFAIKSDSSFDRIDVSINTPNGFGITQLRYAGLTDPADPAASVSVPGSSGWSIAVLAGLGLALALTRKRRNAH